MSIPPTAPAMPPIPTTDATTPPGNISDDKVNRLQEKPWCAAAATPITRTAPHSDATLGTKIIGSTQTAHINIASFRLAFTLLPPLIKNDESQPPATLPASAIR